MNQQQKIEYWQAFDRFRKSRELKYAPKIAKALNAQKAEFIEQFKSQGYVTKLNSLPLQQIIRNLYFDAAITFGAKVLTNVKRTQVKSLEVKRRMPIGFNARMQFLIEQYYGLDFLNLSEGISDTTRQILFDVLTEAQNLGKSFDDIVKELEGTELSKVRSRLIARTETVAASNSGAMLAAQESGILLKKVWIATYDSRTRHTHRGVQTGAIDIDEPFKVGKYEMMQPGSKKQPNGLPVGPEEVCNCRCCVSFVPVRDRGRIVSLN